MSKSYRLEPTPYCPHCGSSEGHVRNRVEMVVEKVWGEGGQEEPHTQMWPCMSWWHDEKIDEEYEALSDEEKKRLGDLADETMKLLMKALKPKES